MPIGKILHISLDTGHVIDVPESTRRSGVRLVAMGVSSPVVQLFELTKVDKFFPRFDSVEDAVGHPGTTTENESAIVRYIQDSTDLERNDMKKGYWIVAYRTVGDDATMKNYVALAGAALGPFGARLLVSPGSAVTAHEAGLKQMTVVVEFDSYEIALAAYESEDYKKALDALGSGVERDFRITEGV